jgi:hypothetical protein
MKRFASFALGVMVCFCLMVATERRAMAYVDPGSGFLALQSAASVMAAVGYFFRRRILGIFKKPEKAAEPYVAAAKGNARKAA